MTVTKKEIDVLAIDPRPRLEKLEETIELLETRIAALEAVPMISPGAPAYTNKCSICDIDFTATMGYVCSNVECPMYPRVGDNYAPGSTGG